MTLGVYAAPDSDVVEVGTSGDAVGTSVYAAGLIVVVGSVAVQVGIDDGGEAYVCVGAAVHTEAAPEGAPYESLEFPGA